MNGEPASSGGFESASAFRPATGTMEEWNAAYVRVEDYLRAHRIHNRLHQSRLILRILERAAERHAVDPARIPTVLAAEESARLMASWFAREGARKTDPNAGGENGGGVGVTVFGADDDR